MGFNQAPIIIKIQEFIGLNLNINIQSILPDKAAIHLDLFQFMHCICYTCCAVYIEEIKCRLSEGFVEPSLRPGEVSEFAFVCHFASLSHPHVNLFQHYPCYPVPIKPDISSRRTSHLLTRHNIAL